MPKGRKTPAIEAAETPPGIGLVGTGVTTPTGGLIVPTGGILVASCVGLVAAVLGAPESCENKLVVSGMKPCRTIVVR